MSNSKPLEFCAHLAKAVRRGTKTTTWKPLSKADQQRRTEGYSNDIGPFIVGDTVRMMEPYGTVGREVVFFSSFVQDGYGMSYDVPVGFQRGHDMWTGVSLLIESCELKKLSDMNEQEAILSGMVPGEGRTHLQEFEKQWRDAYKGAQGWDSDPWCWRVQFRIS